MIDKEQIPLVVVLRGLVASHGIMEDDGHAQEYYKQERKELMDPLVA